MNIREELFKLRDEKYAQFQSKLIPGLQSESIIGVRVPLLRDLAKRIAKEGMDEGSLYCEYLKTLPHQYYDEYMLHGFLVALDKDYDRCVEEMEIFLPYIDNWAVCDCVSPKIFAKNKERLLEKIRKWCSSEETYTIRFGMEMLMTHFLDSDFKEEYLEIPASVVSEEYYVNMMTAWFFATALAKQWDAAITYIEGERLDKWTHNKAIQKARESFRITPEQKEYLKSLKR